MKFVKVSLCLLITLYANLVRAEIKLTPYFSNDSVNGIKVSDAYETHNMGVHINYYDAFYSLDLGIVSPDMHVYKNQYRVANRSFGEVITVTAGQSLKASNQTDVSYYIQLKSSGSYGIDKMQDFMHRLLTLQPVNEINNLVRMPDRQWIGVGGSAVITKEDFGLTIDRVGVDGYLGSDKMQFSAYGSNLLDYKGVEVSSEFGINTVIFDKIVSAPPISAAHRYVIPYFEVGLSFKKNGFNWFVKDKFTLPTIKSDDGLFAVLSAGVSFTID